MIPKKSQIKQHDTMTGTEVPMEIAPEAAGNVIDVLTNLYSDPEMACVREAATNARDSHIEAKQKKPIEVITPTKLLPMLTIRDFGVGLNREDFEQIYRYYGVSTKRTSNKYNGTFGLGCKSPLAYADQFMVTGIKDGTCTTVSIGRRKDGSAAMKILDEMPTDNPNGVTVEIPAMPENNFKSRAEDLFLFWKEGTVLLDGKVPQHIAGIEVTKRLMLVQDYDLYDHYVVMGNVPYPVSRGIEGIEDDYKLIVFARMGEVDFTPSREALEMNDHTKDALKAIEDELTTALANVVQTRIDECATKEEALRAVVEWRKSVATKYLGDLSYKGEKVPREFHRNSRIEVSEPPLGSEEESVEFTRSDEILVTSKADIAEGSHGTHKSVGLSAALGYLYVEGWSNVKFTINHKRKLRKYVEKRREEGDPLPENITNFILTTDRFVEIEPWVDPARFVHWDDIKTIRIENATPRGSGLKASRTSTSYEGYRPGCEYEGGRYAYNLITLQELLDHKGPIFYYERPAPLWKGHRNDLGRTYAKPLLTQHPDAYLVEVTANRVGRFERELPHAISVRDGYEKFTKEAKKLIKVDDVRGMEFREQYPLVKDLDSTRVKDPRLRKAIRLSQREIPQMVEQLNEAKEALRKYGFSVRLSAEIYDPFEPYPLLRRSADLDHEHFYIYVNAAHQHNRRLKKVKV